MAEPITVQFPRLPVTFEKLTTLHHSLVRVYNSLPLKLDGFPNKQVDFLYMTWANVGDRLKVQELCLMQGLDWFWLGEP